MVLRDEGLGHWLETLEVSHARVTPGKGDQEGTWGGQMGHGRSEVSRRVGSLRIIVRVMGRSDPHTHTPSPLPPRTQGSPTLAHVFGFVQDGGGRRTQPLL